MKRLLLSIILLSSIYTLNSIAQTYGWQSIDVPPSVPNTGFTDVKFIGDNVWLTNLSDSIYKVTNEGTSWVSTLAGIGVWTFSIYMFNENSGYAVGEGGAIYETSNGGIDWDYLFNPLSNNLRSIDFSTGSATGYICGDNGTLAEINGVTVTPKTTASVGDLDELSMPTTDDVWTCGDEVVYHYVPSTDSGTISNPAGITTAYTGIDFINTTTGWVVGNGNGIFKTTNGGTTWTQQVNPDSNTLTDIFFLDVDNGWAVGIGGIILHTTDGGDTWTAQTSNTTEILEAVYFTSLTEGYVVGANKTILKFGEITSVDDQRELPTDFSLSQNYPNPFNPSTKISYTIPQTGFVSLKVYDVLGNEVATLINEEKPAGEYEINFNSNGLTSGIYFYRLQAENFIETKKMVLMK